MRIYIELLCSTRPNYDKMNPDVKKQVPAIVRNIKPLMSEKSMKTRQDCFSLLRELLRVISSTIAINLNHCKSLVPLVVASVFDPCNKIATEALLVLQHLDKVIRPADRESQSAEEFQLFIGERGFPSFYLRFYYFLF